MTKKTSKLPLGTLFSSVFRVQFLISVVVLSACSEFGDPGDQTSGRVVNNPHNMSSTNDEIFTARSGAMSLLTIDFPNDRNSQPEVHTVVDSVASLGSHPTTRPSATQAATKPAAVDDPPASGSDEIKIADQQKPADKIVITRDNEGNADLWITCSTGIGGVTLARTGDSWPSIVRMHLLYDKDRAFTRLEGLDAFEVAGEHKVPLKTSIDKESGKGQIAIPGFSRAPQIQIQWVDSYR